MGRVVTLQRSRRDLAGRASSWAEAFPAFAWRTVLPDPTVRLQVRASGCDVRVHAGRDGEVEALARPHVAGEWSTVIPVGDWQWLWVEGDHTEVEWSVTTDVRLPRVTAVVPTFGRPTEARTQSAALLATDVVGHVVVIDQAGTLGDDTAFADLLAAHPERLVLLTQDNLGGSGGYARGMLESLRWPADAVFLGDDDAAIDAESLRRMVVLQALAGRLGERCLVATGMLAAEQPNLLVSLAERVEPRRFWWCPADGVTAPIDVGGPVASWAQALVPRHRADYGGWWGTLLPPGAVAELGYPAPYFLKWDDAEYGLRARRRGWSVRALPGVAVRHPTWAAKGTASGWASLPMHRNRLATAAAYGAGRRVVLDSFVHQVKHVLSLQYPTAELWEAAARQVLAGPDAWLGSDLRHVRGDAQRLLDEMPRPGAPADLTSTDRPPPAIAAALVRALVGLWAPAQMRRQRRVPAERYGWRDGLGSDRVVVDGPDGRPREVMERDPRRARHALRDAVVTHLRLLRHWSRLRAAYRAALPPVTTAGYWREAIGIGQPTK